MPHLSNQLQSDTAWLPHNDFDLWAEMDHLLDTLERSLSRDLRKRKLQGARGVVKAHKKVRTPLMKGLLRQWAVSTARSSVHGDWSRTANMLTVDTGKLEQQLHHLKGTNEMLHRTNDASISHLVRKHSETLSSMRQELESQLYVMPEPLPAEKECQYESESAELTSLLGELDQELQLLKQEHTELNAETLADDTWMTADEKANAQWFAKKQDQQFRWDSDAVSAIRLVVNAMSGTLSGVDDSF